MGNNLSRKNKKSLKYSRDISIPLPETMEAIRTPILKKLEEATKKAKECTLLYNSITNLYNATKSSTKPYQKRFLDDFIIIYIDILNPEDYVQALYTSPTYTHSSGTKHPTIPHLQQQVTNCSIDAELKSLGNLPCYISGFTTDAIILNKIKKNLTNIVNQINQINELSDPTPDDIQHIIVRQFSNSQKYSYTKTVEIATFPTRKEAEIITSISTNVYAATDAEYDIIPITKTTDGFYRLYSKNPEPELGTEKETAD